MPSATEKLLKLTGLLALSFSLGVTRADPPPKEESPKGGIVSLIEAPGEGIGKSIYRATSFVELIDLERADTYKKNSSTCNNPKERIKHPADCPTFEFSVPYLFDPLKPTRSGVEFSEEIAGDIQYEWQRFQERVWWHTQIGMNNAIDQVGVPFELYRPACVTVLDAEAAKKVEQAITGKNDLVSQSAGYRLSIPPGSTNAKFKKPDGLNYDEPDDGLALDGTIHPRLNAKDHYCDGVNLDVIPDNPFPAGVFTPSTMPCVWGVCSPVPVGPYPEPLLIWGKLAWWKIHGRQKDNCTHAATTYYKEYLENITKLIAKKMPLAMHWDGLFSWENEKSGVVMQPVASYKTNIADVLDLSKKIKDPFLVMYLKTYGKAKDGGFIYPTGQYLKNQPGVNQLEEVKRWLPPGNIFEQERDGYTSWFQVYGTVDKVFDLRPLRYWYYSLRCNSRPPFGGTTCWPEPRFKPINDMVVTPAGCQLINGGDGGAGTLTFLFPRYHFRWVSVPEGYPIPGIKNHPVMRLE